MHLTGDLCFMNGSQVIGKRNLKQFFSTSNVSFWKSEFLSTGGFHQRFDPAWGMEDGFLGMLLTINGNKIIPAIPRLALDLKHEKDPQNNR
ncbi:MAG: hypothetical protein IPK25_19330 [Saprospiraceae bacterium]|nr:hypothetical protein [Saprospiraceae bacterium]